MFCSDTAPMLGTSRTTGFWDDRYERLDSATHRKVTRAIRQQERRILADEIADLADPDLHPEDAEHSLGLDWLSQDIMAGNTIWDEFDAQDRAQAAAADRAHRIAMFDHQATWDPALNDRCHDRNLPGWRAPDATASTSERTVRRHRQACTLAARVVRRGERGQRSALRGSTPPYATTPATTVAGSPTQGDT